MFPLCLPYMVRYGLRVNGYWFYSQFVVPGRVGARYRRGMGELLVGQRRKEHPPYYENPHHSLLLLCYLLPDVR